MVGTERSLAMGYFGAELAREKLIKESGAPYSLLRATQFFEFIGAKPILGATHFEARLKNTAAAR